MLTADDLIGGTWQRARKQLEARRDQLRDQLEKDSDPATTAKLRGRIAEVKELLALKAPAAEPNPALAAFGMGGASPNTNQDTSWGNSR